jgi:hypothetical protein
MAICASSVYRIDALYSRSLCGITAVLPLLSCSGFQLYIAQHSNQTVHPAARTTYPIQDSKDGYGRKSVSVRHTQSIIDTILNLSSVTIVRVPPFLSLVQSSLIHIEQPVAFDVYVRRQASCSYLSLNALPYSHHMSKSYGTHSNLRISFACVFFKDSRTLQENDFSHTVP